MLKMTSSLLRCFILEIILALESSETSFTAPTPILVGISLSN